MSDSVRPYRQQPTRLPSPWDSPSKNTRVGCHFLLQCMKVKSESKVVQPCPTLRNPMDCSLPGSPVHGIFQARVLELGAIAFFKNCNTYTHIYRPLLAEALTKTLQLDLALRPYFAHHYIGPCSSLHGIFQKRIPE